MISFFSISSSLIELVVSVSVSLDSLFVCFLATPSSSEGLERRFVLRDADRRRARRRLGRDAARHRNGAGFAHRRRGSGRLRPRPIRRAALLPPRCLPVALYRHCTWFYETLRLWHVLTQFSFYWLQIVFNFSFQSTLTEF